MHISLHTPHSTKNPPPKQGEPEGVFHSYPLTLSHMTPKPLRYII